MHLPTSDEPQLPPAPSRRRVLSNIPTSASALLASVPSVLLVAHCVRAMANDVEVPSLVPPSLLSEARTQNFIAPTTTAIPCLLTFSIYEALHHAVAAAELTARDKTNNWTTTRGVDKAIEQARRFSAAGVLNLVLFYGVTVAVAIIYYFLPGQFCGLFCLIWGIGLLVFVLVLTIGLSLMLRFMRVGVVRRERANTAVYVASLMPALGAMFIFQMLTFAFVYRASGALPTVPATVIFAEVTERDVPPDYDHVRVPDFVCGDLWIKDNYTSTYCSLGAWTFLRPEVGSVTPLDLQQAAWVCDDPFNVSDLTYRSRLDGCAAAQAIFVMFGLVCAAMPLNFSLLFSLVFRETLMGIDAELSWRNWRERSLSRRARASIVLAVLGTLWALAFAMQTFVYPRGTMFIDDGLTFINLGAFVTLWGLAFITLAIEFYLVRFSSGSDLTLIDGKSLREELVKLVKAIDLARSDGQAPNRLTGDVKQLRIGASIDSAHGLQEAMQVGADFSVGTLSEAVKRIEKEFQAAVERAREAHAQASNETTANDLQNAEDDFECLKYVLHERAGSSDKVFTNGNLKRDCDKDGNVLDDRVTSDGHGMSLQDFTNHPSARTAKLLTAHVLALRLYSTAAFVRLNSPMRDDAPDRPTHPFPVTMSYIDEGISKLRAVGAKDGGLTKEDFWRGMRGLSFSDVRERFLMEGGSVPAQHPSIQHLLTDHWHILLA